MILIKEQSTQLFTVPQHIGRQQVKQPGGALFRPEDLKSQVSDTARAESSTTYTDSSAPVSLCRISGGKTVPGSTKLPGVT